MLYCPNFKGVLVAKNERGENMAIVPRCKSWYCSFCAQKNRERWGAVLLDFVNKNKGTGWCWGTLTAHEQSHESTGQYSLKNISRAWDRLMKRMKRKYGNFNYCRVYEKHASGAYHVHFIRSGQWDDLKKRKPVGKKPYNDSVWLRKTARSLGMGYMTHADNLTGDKTGVVVFYVLKYMTKMESADRESWGRVRRIQTSRGIKYMNLEKSEYEWTLKSGLYQHDIDLGGNLYYLLNEGRFLSLDDFNDDYVYPPDNDSEEK